MGRAQLLNSSASRPIYLLTILVDGMNGIEAGPLGKASSKWFDTVTMIFFFFKKISDYYNGSVRVIYGMAIAGFLLQDKQKKV